MLARDVQRVIWQIHKLIPCRGRYDSEQLALLSCPHIKTVSTLVITADLTVHWDCDWRLIQTMHHLPFRLIQVLFSRQSISSMPSSGYVGVLVMDDANVDAASTDAVAVFVFGVCTACDKMTKWSLAPFCMRSGYSRLRLYYASSELRTSA